MKAKSQQIAAGSETAVISGITSTSSLAPQSNPEKEYPLMTTELLDRLERELYPGREARQLARCDSNDHKPEGVLTQASHNISYATANCKSTRPSRCSFKDIPDDILSNVVFRFLKYSLRPLRLVSKRWNAAVFKSIEMHGMLRLKPHCALPTECYRGAVQLDMTTNFVWEAYIFMQAYENVKSLDLEEQLNYPKAFEDLHEAFASQTFGISTLFLSRNKIEVRQAELLAEVLQRQSNITSLHLDYTEIGASEVKIICDALLHNNAIEALYFYGNNFGSEGAERVSSFLRLNTSLTYLYLSDNDIEDEGVNSLAQSLRTNTTLQYLYVLNNRITETGAAALGAALKVNTSLTLLNLKENFIGDDGAISLSDMLRVNTSITDLNVARNDISDLGCVALCEMLRVNSSLKLLKLCGNEFDTKGITALAHYLRASKGLTTLDLNECGIDKTNISLLIDALCDNRSLKIVNFPGDAIGDNVALELAGILKAKGASARICFDNSDLL